MNHQRRTLWQTKEETVIEEESEKESWSMRGDLTHRHHEVLRPNLYVPTEEAVPFPMNFVAVMRQTRTSINRAAKHTVTDYWSEERDVALTEEWVGTTRFQISRTTLPEGYKWANGRPTKIQKTPRPDTIWPEEWPRFSKKLQNGKNRPAYGKRAKREDSSKSDRRCR